MMNRPPRSLCAAAPHPASRDQPSAVLRPCARCPPRGRVSPLGRPGGTDVDIVALVAGLLLPCALGIALLAALRTDARAPAAPGEIAWIVGAGYLVGAFLLTLWMRLLSLAGVHFGAIAIG